MTLDFLPSATGPLNLWAAMFMLDGRWVWYWLYALILQVDGPWCTVTGMEGRILERLTNIVDVAKHQTSVLYVLALIGSKW